MKQIIEIEVPEDKQAIWKDNKIVFEDSAPKLPETWEEFCKLYPIKGWEHFIDSDSLVLGAEKGKRLYKCDRNVLPSLEASKSHLVLMQLHQLRDCYRQGWVPDWKDLTFKYNFQVVDLSPTFNTIKEQTGVIIHGILGSCFFREYKYILDFNNLVAYSKK